MHENPVTTVNACGLPRLALVMLYDALVVVALWFLAGLAALPLTGGGRQVLHDPLLTAWVLLVWFAYLAWCWTHGGQTVGMRAWKVRITGSGGESVSWRSAVVRFGVALVSAACLGAGFWWALADPLSRTWHDRASGTRLVRAGLG